MTTKLATMLALAALAILAVPSIASALTLVGEGEEEVEVGESVTAFSSNLVVEFESGTVECAEDDETGEVESNSGEEIEIGITGSETETTECTSTFGGGAVKIDSVRRNLPWPVKLKAKDVAEVTGVTYTDTATLGGKSIEHCTYRAQNNVVVGTYTTFPDPLEIIVNGAILQKVAPSDPSCEAASKLTAQWAVTAKGNSLFVQ